jgi:D-arabinose 1-dehydrogenase-like Zn-dependent alcohol dehydrogenase
MICPDEVLIEVLYCGVCHSDIHQIANDWKNTIYPCAPSHEIIGQITDTGTDVTTFAKGDIAKHNIFPHVQLINIQDINDAFAKINNEHVRFRYVIDMRSLKK